MDAVAVDDKVVIRWRAEGTFENEIMGQQPTGATGEGVEGISICRFESDKIADAWSQWDVLQFMRDIRALPRRRRAPEPPQARP